MPLNTTEWDLVGCLVLDHLVMTVDPVPMLSLYFPDEAPRWSWSAMPAQNAALIVNNARLADLQDERPFAIRLLQVLVDHPVISTLQDGANVREYLRRLMADKKALEAEDPYAVSLLTGTGQVFINRVDVRQSLRRMVRTEPGRVEPVVLRVRGDSATGTSYTYQLLQHLSPGLGFNLARAVLVRSSTAKDVMRQLAVRIAGIRDQPESARSSAQQFRYWAQWLVEASLRVPPVGVLRPWWFVIDECNKLGSGAQADDVVELISQLSVAISELPVDPVRRRPRLVLLGHDDERGDLPIPSRQVQPDHVHRVTSHDVEAFFLQHFGRKDREAFPEGHPDEELLMQKSRVAAAHVLREAELAESDETDDRCYMKALGDAAIEAIDVYA